MNTNSNAINFGTTCSLDECLQLLIHCGADNRFHLEGEPGSGKTSLMGMMERHFGDSYVYAYLDCAGLDLGDTGNPALDHEKKITEFYANIRFGLHLGKPVVIMLDEFTKAMQPVQNMLHPLLEDFKPRLADKFLPEGTIVFTTGNMSADGVGDNIKAHTVQRVTRIVVRKPNADEWLAWAVENNVNPIVMAWVHQFPHCLDSYLIEDITSNPYPFNPKKVGVSCVSPRTLKKVSNLIDKRQFLSSNSVLAGMIGTIGAPAARDMDAYVSYQDQLPSWDSVVNNPKGAKVPEAPGACAVMVFGAVSKVDRKTIAPWMDYIERLEPEWQAAFAINIAKNPSKQQVAFTSTKFRDWVLANEDIL